MPRLMSVAYTADAVIARRKTVTRRRGWLFLEVGDRLTLVLKSMGRRPGEPLVRLAEVEVVNVYRQRLDMLLVGPLNQPLGWDWALEEMEREGFPGLEPGAFVKRYFTDAQGMRPDAEVTRIEWRYLDDAEQP